MYGERKRRKHRGALQQLMHEHSPYLEIVYNYDYLSDVKLRVKLKTEFYSLIGQNKVIPVVGISRSFSYS